MSDKAILPMRVALYAGHSPAGQPQWVGTLNNFWKANQEAFRWGDIAAMGRDLTAGRPAYVGGGAQATFTLVREEQIPCFAAAAHSRRKEL